MQTLNPEIRKLLRAWLAKTKRLLIAEAKRMDVHESGEFQRTIHARVRESGQEFLAELEMNASGRFVDMGVGRGVPIQTVGKTKGTLRKAKRFYSPVWYGRVHTLYSALSFRMVEEIQRQHKSLDDGNI